MVTGKPENALLLRAFFNLGGARGLFLPQPNPRRTGNFSRTKIRHFRANNFFDFQTAFPPKNLTQRN
jgi:hypothetical protein